MSAYQTIIQEYQQARAVAERQPQDATAAFNLGWWAAKVGRFTEAIACYQRALSLGISDPQEAMTNIASVYAERLGQPTAALEWLASALEIAPDYHPAIFNRAHLAEQIGDRDAALRGFARALALKPDDTSALARLTEAMPVVRADDPWVLKLRNAAHTDDPDVLLALAKVEERLGDFPAAWQALERANAVDRRDRSEWPAAAVRERNVAQLGMLPINATPLTDGEHPSSKGPVFILGMFRTGSTLLEQILAAHPAFSPLGESEYWPRQIAALGGGMVIPGRLPEQDLAERLRASFFQHVRERGVSPAARVTDKRPDNLFHIPTIAASIPEARFVITIRDWRDVLLSVFGTRLHPQHGYATEVTKTHQHLQMCREITNFYEKNWPKTVYVLPYERLVESPESTLRGLLDWLDEPWDPACLNFHQLENAVRTASVWQVREPLNRSRQGRWRRYEAPLREILGDALDEPTP